MSQKSNKSWCIACACDQERDLVFRKNGISILKCSCCGLGAADARDFDPSAYYNEGYFNGNRHDGYADYQASEGILRAEFQKIVDKLQALGASKGTLLELGCAYGFFLMEARKHYDVYGIEISDDAVKSCRTRGLDKVIQGTAQQSELDRIPSLDILVMLDVIEHLERPDQVLESVSAKLKPGGTALLTTGDFSSLSSRLFGQYWRLMTPPQHLWFFTPESLRLLGKRVALELVSVEYPSKRVPLSLILYQLLRPFKPQVKLPKFLSSIALPVNTFDAMRVVFRKADS
jgi:SAM-dependent methyltransferase